MIKVPRFVPLPPWFGGDLQTVRNYLRPPGDILAPWPGEILRFAVKDGTGDELVGTLHRPVEEQQKPLVLLLHGLTGCEESSYVRVTARELLGAGYPVLRLNWRGAGPTLGKTQSFYHAGRTDDLFAVIGSMDGALAANGLAAIGYSLGANILLKYLAERGGLSHLRAAIAVSPPIDLHATQQRVAEYRNGRYHQYLLARMREERPCPLEVCSILEFDNRVVAPMHGFRDALDYYAQCSSGPHLGGIRTPTLVIHAADDPWIPSKAFREIAWSQFRHVRLLMPWSGGHVGFHALGFRRPWHDEVALRFLAATG
ncbi:YheT family hydrolase [Dongia deserti]|uniref:YheT family hydrolase n=1 Tax=Dongia deserti TaxID=2268030 RepID=UPI000E646481|nr:alpha/beta fold hydrolase [Dongia deserti]